VRFRGIIVVCCAGERTASVESAVVAFLSGLFLSAAPSVAQSTQQASAPKLVGGPRALWVYDVRPAAGGEDVLWFSFRLAEGPGADRFVPLPIPGLTGAIRAATVRGDFLHAVFSDGSHWRFAPTSPGWQTVSTAVRFTEVNLPGSAVPRAVCSDGPGDRLYALVSASEGGGDGTTGRWAILRYVDGEWSADRDGPAMGGESAGVVALAVSEGDVHLFAQSGVSGGPITHWQSAHREGAWSPPGILPLQESRAEWAVGWINGRLTVLAAVSHDDGVALELLSYDDGSWREGPAMIGQDGAAVTFPLPVSMALYSGRAVAATRDGSGSVMVGVWSATDGTTIEAPAAVASLNAARGRESVDSMRQLLQYMVLAAVLMLVFLRRREGIMTVAPLSAPFIRARLARRMSGLLIDLAITSPIWLTVVYVMVRTGGADMTFGEQIALGPEGVPSVMFWGWSAVGVVMALYGGICEALMRTTPGKRLVGCTVIGEDGQACRIGGLLIRNVVRIVEFHFPPLAILVFMTPNRQRLGDLLGKSLVVESGPPTVEDALATGADEGSGEPRA
jgi:uncharacterized RDD family membrane protein YckC